MKYIWDRKIEVLEKSRLIFTVAFVFVLVFFSFISWRQQKVIAALLAEREVVPYIVEVDSLGRYRTEKLQYEQLTHNLIATQLRRFVSLWRDAPTPTNEAYNERLQDLYRYIPEGSLTFELMNKFFREEHVERGTLETKVTAAFPLDEKKWRVDWEELTGTGDFSPRVIKKYTATLTVIIVPPKEEKMIQWNPIGVFVQDIKYGEIL